MQSSSRLAFFLLSIILAMVVVVWPHSTLRTQAQSDLVVWKRPVMLPGIAGENAGYPRFPSIVADPWGAVHIFWVQAEQDSQTTDMIYYTRSDGESWLEPYDLFADPDRNPYTAPYAKCDQAGTIHLLWSGVAGLYYSSAPAAEADRVRAWQSVQILAHDNTVGDSDLVVDQDGSLHVVYTERRPGGRIMYLSSRDNGVSWSEPMPLSEIQPSDPQSPASSRIEVDSQDGLHVVWTENYPPSWEGRRVFYARSVDNGVTWTHPMDLSYLPSDENLNINMNLAIDAQDYLHAIWVCGTSPGRCYSFSRDSGRSWSSARPIFEGLIGYGGLDVIASDPYGSVYWASLLRYPQAFYFSSLAKDRWRDPPERLLDESTWGGLGSAHWPQLVIGQGNQLHLVLTEGDQGALWYVRGDTGQPSLPSSPVLPLEASSTLEPTQAGPTSTPQPVPPTDDVVSLAPASEDGLNVSPLVFVGAPMAFLIAVVLLVSRIRSTH
jgi:hypothetical protein